jgi:hypothetical protein
MSDEKPGRTSIESLPLDQWRRARVETIEVQEVEGVVDHPLITVWLEVRILPGPPCVFSALVFVGFFAVFDSRAHSF